MAQILLIEDNVPNMKLAAILLESAGHQVLQAYNAEIGIRLAHEKRPDLILMDIDLPGMDGLTATRLLKSDEQTRRLKIVAMSAFALDGSHDVIRKAGCDDHIGKPIKVKEFMRTVKVVLARRN